MLFLPKKLNIDYATGTHQGSRVQNEDRVLAISDGDDYCFVVADGLGGPGLGDVAAQIVVDVFENDFSAKRLTGRAFLKHAFAEAQKELLNTQIEKNAKNQMKTTATVLLVEKNKAIWGHIGDSRLYLFKRGKLAFRTADHSVVQHLFETGKIKEEDIGNHGDRHSLLRALGTNRFDYELSQTRTLRSGDALLLCTDGLWEHLTTDNLKPQAYAADTWLNNLFEVVSSSQSDDLDNYSAITIIVE